MLIIEIFQWTALCGCWAFSEHLFWRVFKTDDEFNRILYHVCRAIVNICIVVMVAKEYLIYLKIIHRV